MKKFTLMLIAAFVAVVSFAGTPMRKAMSFDARQLPAQRHFAPQQKAVTASLPTVTSAASNLKKAPRRASRKIASIDELEGKWILASVYYEWDEESNDLKTKKPSSGGTTVTITKTGANTIAISGFTSDAENDIVANVDLEAGTLTIADGQTLMTTDYGPIILTNATDEGPITGTINDDGTIDIEQIWCAMIGGDGEYAGYQWSDYYFSFLTRANGSMKWTDEDGAKEVDVYIYQDPDDPKMAAVFNFGGAGTAINVSMKEDHTFVIESQLVEDGGEEYGQFYTYGLDEEGENLVTLTGKGTETTLTFDCNWTIYAPATGYWYGLLQPATITLTDGSSFLYPNIPDVAAMPANPEVLEVGPFDEEEGYGYVLFDVPCTDTEGNDIKESLLAYQLFADIAGEVEPIVFTPELYKNIDEEVSVIPYTFNDNYDFDVYEGSKIIYLNFDFSAYDRIGVKSIYAGGGTTNETEIQWYEIEKPGVDGTFTFDFNTMSVATSSNVTTDGDITEELTLEEGSVTLTVSPKTESATTPNRFWATSNGPQLRVYSGTLTLEAAEGATITGIVFNAGKWNEGNSASTGELGEYNSEEKTVEWTGSAQQVVFTIAANTQINSINVVVEEGGEVTPGGDDQLVELPEGLEPQAWTMIGTFCSDMSADKVEEEVQVAIDADNTIYIQGLSYYFEEAWLKGTIVDGVAVFPSGQFVGEDEYGKEYMLGSEDLETICDIHFAYDPEAQTLTQTTNYILENGETAEEISPYGYWVGVVYSFGAPEPLVPVTPPADLATNVYLLKSMVLEEDDDDESDGVKAFASRFVEYENQVFVGFDNDDIYIQGLSDFVPEGWVKGTKNSDGKYVIPANQYIGTYSAMGLMEFDFFLTAVDESDNLIDVVLDVDSENKVISSDQTLVINESRSALQAFDVFQGLHMVELEEIAAVPADPEFLSYEESEYDGTTYVHAELYIPTKSVDGLELRMDKLAYQFFIEKNGEVMPLVFKSELYDNLDEDVTIIPYLFDDDWDFYRGGASVYLNQPMEEIKTWSKIGVKTINNAGGETHESNIVWFDLLSYWGYEDGVAAVKADGQARYFDITGRAATARQKGLLIKQVRHDDGSVTTAKVLRK